MENPIILKVELENKVTQFDVDGINVVIYKHKGIKQGDNYVAVCVANIAYIMRNYEKVSKNDLFKCLKDHFQLYSISLNDDIINEAIEICMEHCICLACATDDFYHSNLINSIRRLQ